MYFSTRSRGNPHRQVFQSNACLPVSLVPTATLQAETMFTYCICTYCIYYTHLIYIYSYIKFSYRHTFLVLFVRCWLHFQQEASKSKTRIRLWRILCKGLASCGVPSSFHMRSVHPVEMLLKIKRPCWSGLKKARHSESAWSAGRGFPETLRAHWSDSQFRIHRGEGRQPAPEVVLQATGSEPGRAKPDQAGPSEGERANMRERHRKCAM